MSKLRHNVFLVGQLYFDTILHVKQFPEEDTKLRADGVEQRVGGNTCNSAQVLAQKLDQLNVYYMSAVGSRESSKHMVQYLKDRHIQTDLTVLYRPNEFTPFSTIIHSQDSGSRTIISKSSLTDLRLNEFAELFEYVYLEANSLNEAVSDRWWVHFEGRNIDNLIQQMDWLNAWRANEGRACKLTVSVELEKPERENINSLIERGDVIFFSKLFAQHHGFTDAKQFLQNSPLMDKLKQNAKAFCTWGSEGASALINKTKQIISVSPPSVDGVVDTVGAGDTFNAGIIYSLSLKPNKIEEALHFACETATKKVTQQGFNNLF